MKPKNIKERRKTFLKFLLIFLLTVTFILVAVYFNFKVPKKENKLLKDQVKIVKKEMIYQNGFYDNMKSIKGMIDSLDVPGQNISYQSTLINKKLVDLQKSVPTKDSTYRYDMYMNILDLYVELQSAKEELRSLVDAKSTIEEYKDALDKCREELKQAERDLFIARSSN